MEKKEQRTADNEKDTENQTDNHTGNNMEPVTQETYVGGEKESENKTSVKRVKNTQKEKDAEKLKKQRLKNERKSQRDKKYPGRLSFIIGLLVVIFAVIGIVLIIWNSVSYIKRTMSPGNEYARYNEYLASVAAVDPDPFDDITAADTEQLLNAAIWSILNNDSTPDTYSYSGGYMLIPSSDVGNAYVSLFGPETVSSLEYKTVQGYNCTFEYDSSTKMYKIPVTTIQPIYTPHVEEVDKSGSSIAITVSFLSSESWRQDNEGNYIAPEPDKVMRITLREIMGSYYISAIQTVSSTIPEIVSFEPSVTTPTPNENSTEDASREETLTEKVTQGVPEITTLGGRV